ncbi:hypothetical protein KGH46_04225, partial [Bacteroides thetaiotaomicron]|uniref:hypothetical protein n=1 Tax=Bacteroides thetaiotaomicron TaxID=818 RepID=UPI001CE25304
NPCFRIAAEGREIFCNNKRAWCVLHKKSAVLFGVFPFFSSLSEKISFLFACFPKYVHLCSVLSPRYLQSNRL